MGSRTRAQGRTFGEKFEAVLQQRKKADPAFGLRTIARAMSGGDPKRTETIRRQLHKYRPGSEPHVSPTPPTRHEIERALGLERDALKSDDDEEVDPAMRARQLRAELVLLGRDDLAQELLDLLAVGQVA